MKKKMLAAFFSIILTIALLLIIACMAQKQYILSRYETNFAVNTSLLAPHEIQSDAWYSIQRDDYVDGSISRSTKIVRKLLLGYVVSETATNTEKTSSFVHTSIHARSNDSNGQLYKIIADYPSDSIEEYISRGHYYFDENNNITSFTVTTGRAVASDTKILHTLFFEYDEHENLKKQKCTTAEGKTTYIMYEYADDNTLVKSELYDNNNVLQYYSTHDYGERGCETVIYCANGEVYERHIQYFSQTGKLIEHLQYGSDNALQHKTVYSYNPFTLYMPVVVEDAAIWINSGIGLLLLLFMVPFYSATSRLLDLIQRRNRRFLE